MAMAQVEDESDRIAGQQCQAEATSMQRREDAEFTDSRLAVDADPDSVAAFTSSVQKELTPIELYALDYNAHWVSSEQVRPKAGGGRAQVVVLEGRSSARIANMEVRTWAEPDEPLLPAVQTRSTRH